MGKRKDTRGVIEIHKTRFSVIEASVPGTIKEIGDKSTDESYLIGV